MKLVSAQHVEDLQTELKKRFAEFNRSSSPSKGRRYPVELHDLVRRAIVQGVPSADVRRLTGLSPTAVMRWAKAAKPKVPRRLKVVNNDGPRPAAAAVVVRLPSGVAIELTSASALNPELLASLARLEVNHAAVL